VYIMVMDGEGGSVRRVDRQKMCACVQARSHDVYL
jgi:hypothetical protein